MTTRWMLALGLSLLVGIASAQNAPELRNHRDKVSYGMGVQLARNLRQQQIDVDLELVIRGFEDVLAGKPLLMSDADLRETLTAYQAELKARQAQAATLSAADNRKAGERFLAENQHKEGVVTLPSGVQYKILKTADGRKPTIDDKVVCHYRGTLIDGTEFDSSYRRNRPTTFPVNRVIKGWTEALQLMPVGSTWQLFIPSQLAYAEKGSGSIGPNATLIFEVELIAIEENR